MSAERESLFAASYRVVSHTHVDDEFAEVVIRCLGFPTHGVQPVAWPLAIKVPRSELSRWPLGLSVRLTVT
jgi:hypothetical protein